MKKIIITILIFPLLFSCANNDMEMASLKESRASSHTEIDEVVNWDFVADRRAGSVVGADLIGGVFGFLKGGFVGALLWGTLSSVAQSTVNELQSLPVYIGAIEDDFILNNQNPYEFVGLFHYKVINEELRKSYGSYKNMDEVLFENHFNDFVAYKDRQTVIYPELNRSNYPYEDYEQDFEAFITFHDGVKEEWLSQEMNLHSLEVLQNYFTLLEESKSVKDFVDKSLDAEEFLLADISLGLTEKELLLSTMSTARIGLQYWAWVIRELDKD